MKRHNQGEYLLKVSNIHYGSFFLLQISPQHFFLIGQKVLGVCLKKGHCKTRIISTTVSTRYHCTVSTSWWAFSLLIEYTMDKRPQLDLELGPHSKSCELNTKDMFYLLARLVFGITLVSKKDYPFSLIHGLQIAPLPLPGLVVSYPDQFSRLL